MRKLIKIVAVALLSTTLSGAVIAADEDIGFGDGSISEEARNLTKVKQLLGIEDNASGTAVTITLSLSFSHAMELHVDSLIAGKCKRLIAAFQHVFKPLLDVAYEGKDCVFSAILYNQALAGSHKINLKSKEFALDFEAPDLGILHDFIIGLKKDVLDKLLILQDGYVKLRSLAGREHAYITAGSADSSGYASLPQIIADLNTLEERRKCLTDEFSLASVVTEYETFLNKAKRFRGGPKNKDLEALYDDAFLNLVSIEKYETMKAKFFAQAEMCGAIIVPGNSEAVSVLGAVHRFVNNGVASESRVESPGRFVYRLDYDAKKAELKAIVLQEFNRLRSRGVTGLPISEIRTQSSFCAWHALSMSKEINARCGRNQVSAESYGSRTDIDAVEESKVIE